MNGNPEWNESMYFNFHDERNDITAFMRIGNKPNKDEKSMFFFVMNKDIIAGMRTTGPCDDDKWSSGGLEFIDIGNDKWRLIYNGPIFDTSTKPPKQVMLEMDVEWESLNKPMDYRDCVDERKTQMSADVASEHYEQFGHVVGTMKIDDETTIIDSYGERDKSIGVRDWGSPKMWMWINSQYEGKEAFNISKLTVDKGEVDAGYFHANGRNNPLNAADIKVNYKEGVPCCYSMKLFSIDGKEYPVEGSIIRFAMLPFGGSKQMVLIESIAETKWNGKKGFGIAEFLVPLHR